MFWLLGIIKHPNYETKSGKQTPFETTCHALVAADFQAHTKVQLRAITGIHPSKVLAISLFGRPHKHIQNRNEIQWGHM